MVGSGGEEGGAARRAQWSQMAGRVAWLTGPEGSSLARRTKSSVNFRRLILQFHAEWRGVTVAETFVRQAHICSTGIALMNGGGDGVGWEETHLDRYGGQRILSLSRAVS